MTATENCRDCNAEFTYKPNYAFGREVLKPRVCRDCILNEQDMELKKKLKERGEKWLSVCPPEYRYCDPKLLPSDRSRAALNEALRWENKPPIPGLGIVGRTSGLGKTRIAYAAAHRHFMEGSSFMSIGAADFAMQCSSKYGDGLRAWVLPMMKAGILLIDDLGKERAPSDHVASTMFSLIEARVSHRRAILLTTNNSVEEISQSYRSTHGQYIVRRLQQFCQFVRAE